MSEDKKAVYDSAGLKFGPLWVTPGVSGKNLLTLFFASFFGIASMSFINFSQPYVFTELLNIPLEEQGTLAGRLTRDGAFVADGTFTRQ